MGLPVPAEASIADLTDHTLEDILRRLSLADLTDHTLEDIPRRLSLADLTDHTLEDILRCLSHADLLRAALVCHRWRRLAARCLPRAPPLLGYFFHPVSTPSGLHIPGTAREKSFPAVFAPLDASSSPRLSLDFAPDASSFTLFDCHQGLLLFQPDAPPPKTMFPSLLVLDPASRRRALLPPPPRDLLPEDSGKTHYVGSALLSRAHPSRLRFEAVCFAIDGGRPRAWVASVDDGECRWRALPRDADVEVDFHPWWFEGRCVHAAGSIYWHICNSDRTLALDPATLRFSYLRAPADLVRFSKYRIGEMAEDGRLFIASVEDEKMQVWVRGEDRWLLHKKMDLHKLWDSVPSIPRCKLLRILSIMISDIDAGRTGKLFITTTGCGRYSLGVETGKLERLVTNDGKEYGHPIFAYYLAWPPAFLAPEASV